MKLKEWGSFALLALIWGSSFLWIKLAVREIGPFALVALRLMIGFLALLIIMRLKKQSFPRDGRLLLPFIFMGAFNAAIPITLISWSETRIDSALAAILNGTVPLFTIVIAHFWLPDEKINLSRVIGLIIGFIGVIVLVSRDIGPEGLHGTVWGQTGVLAAAICYATSITFSRRYLRGQKPLVQSTIVLLFGDLMMWVMVPFTETTYIPTLPITWFAITWLGVFGSCLAYLLYFYLIGVWGPTRASVVSYLFPVIGLVLGVVFLNEIADWRLLAGSLLVLGGIAIINCRPKRVVEMVSPGAIKR